jgi:plasmid stability protein
MAEACQVEFTSLKSTTHRIAPPADIMISSGAKGACTMADILIRRVSEKTKALLARRARRRGVSLEAELRDALEQLARESAETPDEAEPFGTWLVSVSRPGTDLDENLALIRSARIKPLEEQ